MSKIPDFEGKTPWFLPPGVGRSVISDFVLLKMNLSLHSHSTKYFEHFFFITHDKSDIKKFFKNFNAMDEIQLDWATLSIKHSHDFSFLSRLICLS